MWRLWLFLALIGLLIWGFARLQQRNRGRSSEKVLPPVEESDEGSDKDGAEKISNDQSVDGDDQDK